MRGGRPAVGWVCRIVVLLSLVAPGVAAGQTPLERRAGLTVVDEPLELALRRLQQATGIALVFSPDLLPGDTRVSCACETSTVEEALRALLRGTGLGFVSRGALVTIIPAQGPGPGPLPGVVRGQVMGRESGEPIENVRVEIRGVGATLTGQGGWFELRAVPPGAQVIRASALGWRQESPVEVAVAGADTVRVTVALSRVVIPLPELLIQPGTFGMLEDVPPGTARTITREEIQELPELGEDVFRAMNRLPGVASGDLSTRLTLRGGPDREVLVRLDGLELYDPYHVKDWDGALGIVDINLLGGAELLTGGFGVGYGDRMSGVLDMTSRRPESGATTTLGLSISNATFLNRGTFHDGRGAWLFAGRRGFLDLIMDLANEGRRLSPSYYDVFGKVSFEPTPVHRVSARFLLAGDRFLLRDPDLANLDAVDFRSEWASRYGWMTWEAYPSSEVSLETIVWTGELRRRRGGEVEDAAEAPFRISASDHRDFSFFGARSVLTVHASDHILFRLGAEGKGLRAEYDYAHRSWSSTATEDSIRGIREDSVSVSLTPNGRTIGAFAALRARPADRWTAEVGLRYDQISYTGDRDLSPRVMTVYEASARTHLRASLGRYVQSHGLQELSVGDGETEFLPSEVAHQLALGLDHRFPGGIELRFEAYRRIVADPAPVYFNAEQEVKVFPEAAGDRLRIDPDRGRARGVELLVEWKSESPWAWSASYALASAEDRVAGTWVPRPFDQRHTVGGQVAYRPGPRWSFSLGWRFHTGWPATAWSWNVNSLEDGWNIWSQEFGPVRGTRLPAFHRLDLRATRTLTLARGTLQLFLDVLNVYNRANLRAWDYSGAYESGILTVERVRGQEMLPFLPTFGFRYEF